MEIDLCLDVRENESGKKTAAVDRVEWKMTRADLSAALANFLWKSSYRPGLWVYMTTREPVLAVNTPIWMKADGERVRAGLMPLGKQLVSIERGGSLHLMNVFGPGMCRSESVHLVDLCLRFGVSPGATFGEELAATLPRSEVCDGLGWLAQRKGRRSGQGVLV